MPERESARMSMSCVVRSEETEGFDSGGCALMRALWTSLCLKVKGAKRSMIEHVIE